MWGGKGSKIGKICRRLKWMVPYVNLCYFILLVQFFGYLCPKFAQGKYFRIFLKNRSNEIRSSNEIRISQELPVAWIFLKKNLLPELNLIHFEKEKIFQYLKNLNLENNSYGSNFFLNLILTSQFESSKLASYTQFFRLFS